jgi:ATP-dependent RNA helicase DeaD
VVATPLSQAHADIAYVAHLVSQREREHAVVNTLRAFDEVKALVFCETRLGVSRLHASLVERGFAAAALSGELSQPERARALASLRDGRARVLVATDVAARGIDLPDIGLVVHADLPHDAEVMQHRSGRTGRAGRKGVSVLLVPVSSRVFAQRLLSKARVTADWAPVPTAEVIRTQEKERLFQELLEESKAVDSDELDVARRLLVERTPEQLVSALVRASRSKRPSPEELPETEQAVLRALKRPASRPVSAGPEDGVRRAPASHPAAGHGSGHAAGSGAPRPTRPSRPVPEVAATGAPTAEGVWFHLNVGRSQKADPKWLVPLLCKRGGVTKAELGRIVILAEETRFAVVAHAAVKFAALSKRPDPREPGIRIRLLRPAEETAETAKRPRPDRPGRA